MDTTEMINTAVAAVATTVGASDIAQIMEQTGEISIPAAVVTAVNCLILIINAGIAIYKKIRDIKNENAENKNADINEGEIKNNGTDGRAEE